MSNKEMKDVIPPIDKKLLVKELNHKRFVRKTNYGDNEIYIISHNDSPNVMQEIGRLREITFRKSGGGTGKSLDIDDYDTAEHPYQQLIVWEPERKEIIGGYRFINGSKHIPKDNDGNIKLATTGLFNFSEKFENEYMPYTIELGRSFIQTGYQSGQIDRRALFSLDNLWDGLGALIVQNPTVKYFIGKITMYPDYNTFARDLILYFFKKYFHDKDTLIYPKAPLLPKTDTKELSKLLNGANYKEDFKIMKRKVRDLNEIIPPLFNSYMNLSPDMRVFGTAVNPNFGGVEETGILINIANIYESKTHRHVSTYSV